LRHGSARISFEKKNIHILHAWKKCTCTHVVTTRQTNCHSSWWRLQQLKERKGQVESRKRKNEKEEVGKKKKKTLFATFLLLQYINPPLHTPHYVKYCTKVTFFFKLFFNAPMDRNAASLRCRRYRIVKSIRQCDAHFSFRLEMCILLCYTPNGHLK
jgi:hypothetical protein